METLLSMAVSITVVAALSYYGTSIERSECATAYTTLWFLRTVIVGDAEKTTVFGIPVYARLGHRRWLLGLAWGANN